MSLSPQQSAQLALLRDIFEVSALCDTRTYIWAGLVRDVLSGAFLREHGDVDGFTRSLWEKRQELAAHYEQRGCRVSYLEGVQMMRIDRDGVHAAFNRLDIDGDTAIWRHIGEQGAVYFPQRWLPVEPILFYDAQVYPSGVAFEYCIKSHPELLSPLWKGRAKDVEAIAWLEGMLVEQHLGREEALQQVWSYNPFWVKKGYPEYAMPTVARPLAPRQ